MTTVTKAMIGLFAASVFVGSGCGDVEPDADPDENEQEVITTLNATFTPVGGGTAITASFRDADGDGGADPVTTDPMPFAAGTTYTLSIELLNETEEEGSEEYNIGNEIREEAEDHQFFFTGDAVGTILDHMYADQESDYVTNSGDDLPVGISSSIEATTAGTGTLTITLKHQPPVNGQDVKTSTSTVSDGETDIEVSFAVTVQ
ncbi:MAG: type 1 periplasmic binding fold superfamily protein [Myxococcota bacterium]